MGKRKLTLSVDEGLLREARIILAGENRGLSDVFEEFLRYVVSYKWVEELARELDLGSLETTSPKSIKRERPRGLEASKVIREIRSRY